LRASLWISLLVFCASAAGCQSAPAQPSGPLPAAIAAATDFSGDAAFAHLRALAALGPRVTGTPGAAAARAYLRAELEKLGVRVEERRVEGPPGPDGAPQELVNLVAVIPGNSPQIFVLAAPYDTRRFESFPFIGANDGASAPALLLELARAIQVSPLRYTTWIVFLDGEAPRAAGAADDAEPALAGSNALARELLAEPAAAPVRLVVLFQQVGDVDLHIARDLRSHRLYREEFWLAAARLGRKDVFRPQDPFESPAGSHEAFLAAGFRGVVLITDPSYGGDEPPGAFANSEDDTPEHCSPQSLASVGVVTLETLDQIGGRLAKIDRFTKPVVAAPPVRGEAPSKTEPATDAASKTEPATDAASKTEPATDAASKTEPATDATSKTEPATDATSKTEPAVDATSKTEPAVDATSKTEPAVTPPTQTAPAPAVEAPAPPVTSPPAPAQESAAPVHPPPAQPPPAP